MLVYALLAVLAGAALLGAAALKAGDPTGTAIAAETYGLSGRAARWIWLPLAVTEAALAAGTIAGSAAAAGAAAALLAAFALVLTTNAAAIAWEKPAVTIDHWMTALVAGPPAAAACA